MAANVWDAFQALIPQTPIGYGQVLSHDTGNTSRVQLPTGDVIHLRGQTVAVGDHCWFRSGEIIGDAPAMTVYTEYV